MRYHIEDLLEMATPDLQFAYKNATGECADRRWSDRTIIKKMQEYWAERDLFKIQEQHRIEQEEREIAERAARIKERGLIRDFAAQSASDFEDAADRNFLYAIKSVVETLEDHSARARRLGDDYANHPEYCLTWADSYFEHAAKHFVATFVKDLFSEGYSREVITEDCRKEMLRAAGSRNRSTSVCSNVMEEEKRKAWTEMYCRLANDSRW